MPEPVTVRLDKRYRIILPELAQKLRKHFERPRLHVEFKREKFLGEKFVRIHVRTAKSGRMLANIKIIHEGGGQAPIRTTENLFWAFPTKAYPLETIRQTVLKALRECHVKS